MADLTKLINSTLNIINNREHQSEMRPYLGGSEIGHNCSRYLWYKFRWCVEETLSNRIYRLFNRGHKEEDVFIENLRYAGVAVYSEQREITFAYGHGKGHIDGLAINVTEAHKAEHLLEFKTMSDKYFKEIQKIGVKKAKPIYYDQCQIYMSKLQYAKRALFCAVNKNDDNYYFERLKLDVDRAADIERKAEFIVLSELPPPKINENSTWFECKWCNAAGICHHKQPINETCRTCSNIGIEQDGWWSCGEHGIYLSNSQQKLMCDKYIQQEM